MASKSAVYEHVDAIGRPLKVGDPVAVPDGITSIMIGRITSIGEKQIRVVEYGEPEIGTRHIYKNGVTTKVPTKAVGILRYSKNVVSLDCPEILVYLMKFKA